MDLHERLARYQIARRVVIVADKPRTASGQTGKAELPQKHAVSKRAGRTGLVILRAAAGSPRC